MCKVQTMVAGKKLKVVRFWARRFDPLGRFELKCNREDEDMAASENKIPNFWSLTTHLLPVKLICSNHFFPPKFFGFRPEQIFSSELELGGVQVLRRVVFFGKPQYITHTVGNMMALCVSPWGVDDPMING